MAALEKKAQSRFLAPICIEELIRSYSGCGFVMAIIVKVMAGLWNGTNEASVSGKV